MNQSSNPDNFDEILVPPSALRVAARALVMSAVTCRGFIEQDAEDAAGFWSGVRTWFYGLELMDEIEPWEREVIDCPLGRLDPKLQANSTWLCEGLAVLAWALQRFPLPAHDQSVIAAQVSNTLGFKVPKQQTVLASPSLRAAEEIGAFSDKMFAIHWRIRDFTLSGKALNFKSFVETAWFGPLDIEGTRLIETDLAIGDMQIAKAEPKRIRECLSIAVERHRASNWLAGRCPIYSDTDTST